MTKDEAFELGRYQWHRGLTLSPHDCLNFDRKFFSAITDKQNMIAVYIGLKSAFIDGYNEVKKNGKI